jgi:hypothetical protein
MFLAGGLLWVGLAGAAGQVQGPEVEDVKIVQELKKRQDAIEKLKKDDQQKLEAIRDALKYYRDNQTKLSAEALKGVQELMSKFQPEIEPKLFGGLLAFEKPKATGQNKTNLDLLVEINKLVNQPEKAPEKPEERYVNQAKAYRKSIDDKVKRQFDGELLEFTEKLKLARGDQDHERILRYLQRFAGYVENGWAANDLYRQLVDLKLLQGLGGGLAEILRETADKKNVLAVYAWYATKKSVVPAFKAQAEEFLKSVAAYFLTPSVGRLWAANDDLTVQRDLAMLKEFEDIWNANASNEEKLWLTNMRAGLTNNLHVVTKTAFNNALNEKKFDVAKQQLRALEKQLEAGWYADKNQLAGFKKQLENAERAVTTEKEEKELKKQRALVALGKKATVYDLLKAGKYRQAQVQLELLASEGLVPEEKNIWLVDVQKVQQTIEGFETALGKKVFSDAGAKIDEMVKLKASDGSQLLTDQFCELCRGKLKIAQEKPVSRDVKAEKGKSIDDAVKDFSGSLGQLAKLAGQPKPTPK